MSERERKGTFADRRLPVWRRYQRPLSRAPLLWAGGALAAAALVFAAGDALVGSAHFLSNGPLSSKHAAMEITGECGLCHESFGSAASDRCLACHDQFASAPGSYSMDAHTLYRSADWSRIDPEFRRIEGEGAQCSDCHREHRGRQAAVTEAADAVCLRCHEWGTFESEHPRFFTESEDAVDRAELAFTHTKHVRRIVKRRGALRAEDTCRSCHQLAAGARHFEPIDYERHCSACHINALDPEASRRLPLRSGREPYGVLSLEAIQRSAALGTGWTRSELPSDYETSGGTVRKRRLRHADPWVLHNLRLLRQQVHGPAGLADLLDVAPGVEPHEVRSLYLDAVATLERHVLELSSADRGTGEALGAVESRLADLKRWIREEPARLEVSAFRIPQADPERREAAEPVIQDLTRACRKCHQLDRVSIAAVESDQRTLRNADFDHGAHVLQVGCLDCHDRIPIAEALADGARIPEEQDHAGIYNLPGIESCRGCHSPELGSTRCVSCHAFHAGDHRQGGELR